MAELGILTASLLHEMRQPLFAVHAMCQLSRGGEADPAETLLRVEEHIQHIAELVEFYSGLGLSQKPDIFDLNQPVAQAVAILHHRSRSSGVDLEIELHKSPLLVQGREGGARQVLTNLLHNALDAASNTPARSVTVRTRPEGSFVAVEVQDSGTGVPASLRPRLFEPFVSTKGDNGTGLGLYIARELVREARGELTVDTAADGGTLFVARYPRVGRPTTQP